MSDVKLCKDCRFYVKKWLEPDHCIQRLQYGIDPVRGGRRVIGYLELCGVNRDMDLQENCGPDAKLFEPRRKG